MYIEGVYHVNHSNNCMSKVPVFFPFMNISIFCCASVIYKFERAADPRKSSVPTSSS